jgi:hypothetical protein
VDSIGQAAAAGLTIDKAAGDLVISSSVKTRAVVTYTGKPSGEQWRQPTRRDHSGGTATYPARASEK